MAEVVAPAGEADQQHISATLAAHNQRRETHLVEPLVWDAECYTTAQKWAVKLADEAGKPGTDGKNKGMSHGGVVKGMGQNLWWSPDDTASPEDAVAAWMRQAKHYSVETPTDAGHFTQVVWKKTRKVGLGIVRVPRPSDHDGAESIPDDRQYQFGTFVVAHYHPHGNTKNKFEKNVFIPLKKAKTKKPRRKPTPDTAEKPPSNEHATPRDDFNSKHVPAVTQDLQQTPDAAPTSPSPEQPKVSVPAPPVEPLSGGDAVVHNLTHDGKEERGTTNQVTAARPSMPASAPLASPIAEVAAEKPTAQIISLKKEKQFVAEPKSPPRPNMNKVLTPPVTETTPTRPFSPAPTATGIDHRSEKKEKSNSSSNTLHNQTHKNSNTSSNHHEHQQQQQHHISLNNSFSNTVPHAWELQWQQQISPARVQGREKSRTPEGAPQPHTPTPPAMSRPLCGATVDDLYHHSDLLLNKRTNGDWTCQRCGWPVDEHKRVAKAGGERGEASPPRGGPGVGGGGGQTQHEQALITAALLNVDQERVEKYLSGGGAGSGRLVGNNSNRVDARSEAKARVMPLYDTSGRAVYNNPLPTTNNDNNNNSAMNVNHHPTRGVTSGNGPRSSIDTYFSQQNQKLRSSQNIIAPTTVTVPSRVHIDPLLAGSGSTADRHGYKSRLASCPLYRPPRADGAPASPPRSQNFTGDFRYYKRNVLDNVRSHFHAAATAAQQHKNKAVYR